MYVQITTRCNMTCAHCCFGCTTKGEDMSLKTFRQTLQLAKDYDEYLTIGGGEPTVHPKFEQFLLEAIATLNQPDERRVFVITNGKLTHRAEMVYQLTKSKVICSELSVDEYHDPIDGRIRGLFLSISAIRNTTRIYEPTAQGRAITVLGYGYEDSQRCMCESIFIEPDGDIRQCGCPDAPVVGTVADGIKTYVSDCCHRSAEYAESLAELAEENE